MKRFLGGAGAALGLKLVTGLAVAASAAVLAGAATEVVVTRSVNPSDWSRQVHQTMDGNQHGQQTDTVKPAPTTNDAGGDVKNGGNANGSGNGGSTGGSNGGTNPKKPLGSPPTGGNEHPGPPPVPAN